MLSSMRLVLGGFLSGYVGVLGLYMMIQAFQSEYPMAIYLVVSGVLASGLALLCYLYLSELSSY